jgi:hypothetical protein
VCPPELVDGGRGKRPDTLLGTGDLAPERRVVEHRQVEEHVHVLGGIIEVRANLLDDDVTLVLDLCLVEVRPDHELTQHLHRGRRVAGGDPHVVDGRFAVRRRIEGPAQTLHGLREGTGRRVRVRTLERQVLHEMGAARLSGSLVARAGQDVCLDGERAGARQSCGDDTRPGGQRGAFEHPRKGIPNDTSPDADAPSDGSRRAILDGRSHPGRDPWCDVAASRVAPARGRPPGPGIAWRRRRSVAGRPLGGIPLPVRSPEPGRGGPHA